MEMAAEARALQLHRATIQRDSETILSVRADFRELLMVYSYL